MDELLVDGGVMQKDSVDGRFVIIISIHAARMTRYWKLNEEDDAEG